MGTAPTPITTTTISVYKNSSPFVTCDVVWGDGTAQTGTQSNQTTPIIFTKSNYVTNPNGYVFKFRPGGQNWSVTNQILTVNDLGFAGITNFDMDLSKFTSLEEVSIGSYLSSNSGGVKTRLSLNNSISSFSTFFPTTSTPSFTFNFENNQVDCSFNPAYNSIHTFTFKNNQQSTPILVESAFIKRVNITNNPLLTNVIVRSFKSLEMLNLSNNSLNQVLINSLFGVSNVVNLIVNLSFNDFSSFQNHWITGYPSLAEGKEISINLSNNKFTTFNCRFSGLTMGALNLSTQQPIYNSLNSVDSVATSGTTFKEFNFSNNPMTDLPIINQQTQKFYCNNCRSTFLGTGKGTGVIKPNLVSSLQIFQMDNTTNSSTERIVNFADWTPNDNSFVPNNLHTRLGQLQNLQLFSLKNQLITSWVHQFSPTLPSNSVFDLSQNSLTTFDMNYVGGSLGFSSVLLDQQKAGAMVISNLNNTSVPNLNTLSLSYNSFANLSDLIHPTNPWPSKLCNLGLLGAVINFNNDFVWNKSFATFAAGTTTPINLNFQAAYTNTALHNNNLGFILRNLWSATTKTGGIVNLTQNSLTQSTIDAQAWNCLSCLAAPLSTPCNVPGVTTSLAFGRGMSVLF